MAHCIFNSVSGIPRYIQEIYFNNTLIKTINPESNYCYVGTVQEFVLGDLEDKKGHVTHDVMVTSPWKSERTAHSFDQKGDFPMAFHHPGDVNMCPVITLHKLL